MFKTACTSTVSNISNNLISKLSNSYCIYAYSGKKYAKYPLTKVRFFKLSLLLYYYYRLTLFSYIFWNSSMLLYFILCFINVHLKIAVFCTRFTKDGTKECFPHYHLYGDICTGIANAFILSKHLYCINTYMYSFHNYKHARYDS